jgi:lysozyme family protein
MMDETTMQNRRCFLLSLLGTALANSYSNNSLGQNAGKPRDDEVVARYRAIQDRLSALLPDAEKSALSTIRNGNYDVILPGLVDIINKSSEIASSSAEKAEAATGIRQVAEDLLLQRTQAERSPAVDNDKAALDRYPYEELKDGYSKLFDNAEIRPERASLVNWHVSQLNRDDYRKKYEAVGSKLSIPWYFVGIIHSLEAGFNFKGHLHNGDPLTARTVQVPKGRPPTGNPPFDWVDSAVDALTMHNFQNQTDWSLPRMLYRWEMYNGFGYRGRKVPSPYLWSFTNRYGKPEAPGGKYVADGHFDSNAVSLQCGAAGFLLELVKSGEITLPREA